MRSKQLKQDNNLKIFNVDIEKLSEYENNPRKNDEAVKYVANSIKSFGFKVPIVVDENNVIVCGHTRYKAALKLGYKEVPCIIADDLTPQEIKAFRLADNKVAQSSSWNIKRLQAEMGNLPEFDFEEFNFNVPEVKINERINTVKTYNLDYFEKDEADNYYGIPEIKGTNYIPDDLIGFNYAKSSKDTEKCVHFYIDDYQFERVWNRPEKYIEVLEKFDCVLTPDFSLYLDMPLAMKIWNTYRSRLMGSVWQNAGLLVIPTVSWAEPETYKFCFDGLPENSVLSVSTVGVKQSKTAMQIWRDGMDELIKRKNPSALLVYGGELEYDYKGIDVHYYKNNVTERMKSNGR